MDTHFGNYSSEMAATLRKEEFDRVSLGAKASDMDTLKS